MLQNIIKHHVILHSVKIEIDQSGKVEYTASHTVIGSSNGESIYIPSREKRILQQYFREHDLSRQYTIIVFSALIAYLIKDIDHENLFVIDEEYPGRFADIERYVIYYLRKLGNDIESGSLRYGKVGKQSDAHLTAHAVFLSKKATYHINAEDLIRLIALQDKTR